MLGHGEVVAQTPASKAVSDRPAFQPSPLRSAFKTQKVLIAASGNETLEDTSSAQVGDLLQYSAEHTNVSSRRLLKVDFAIPVPEGTRYVEGSARPADGMYLQESGGKRMVRWRVAALQPGEAVLVSLRVLIEPDPSLRAPPPAKPRPELRR